VTKRERALAQTAGELAKREAGVEERRAALDQLEARLNQRDAELGETKQQLAARVGEIAASQKELEVLAAKQPAPAPEPATAPVQATRAGSWNINDLQRTVGSQSGATPEQEEEWTAYLFFLRQHAASDGSLPRQFDGLVEDVFGALPPG